MLPSQSNHRFRGRCHCSALTFDFASPSPAERLCPRACDCSFCQKHGASWLSHPQGRLAINITSPAPIFYRQGSGAARFMICGGCGVLVAVLHEHEGTDYGAVNAACLDDFSALAPALTVSPQTLGAQEKLDRWRQVWVPNVKLTTSGT